MSEEGLSSRRRERRRSSRARFGNSFRAAKRLALGAWQKVEVGEDWSETRAKRRRATVYIGNEVSDTLFHFLRDRDYTKPWVEHREIKLTFVLLLCTVLNRRRPSVSPLDPFLPSNSFLVLSFALVAGGNSRLVAKPTTFSSDHPRSTSSTWIEAHGYTCSHRGEIKSSTRRRLHVRIVCTSHLRCVDYRFVLSQRDIVAFVSSSRFKELARRPMKIRPKLSNLSSMGT